MAQNRQNMGSGPVKPLLLQLMIPAVVAQVVNLLYNIVDRIYIGHIEGIGAAALTGVGLFAPILMLLNAFAMLIGAGGAPRTAIALGQGNKDEAEKIIGNSFTMLLFFAVVLTAGFYAGAPALLRLFGASDATLPYAVAYGRIYILGSVFVLLVMGMNPFITTQGFAKISMLTTVIGAVINIILDPILIFGLGWGVRGAAVATVLSQAVGACWILKFLTGPKTILKLRKENLKVERNIILPVMGLGISTFVMLSTESLLSISFSSSLARYGGDVAVGAMTVITSASQLCTLPIQGICQGGQPVMSFNFGAGKKPRVKEAFRFQLTLCFGYTTLFWLLMMLPRRGGGIFTSDAASSNTPHGPCASTWRVSSHGRSDRLPAELYGAGSGQSQLLLACLRKIILLIPLIFILPCFTADKCFGVFLAEPVSDILAATITAITFFSRFDKILDKGAEGMISQEIKTARRPACWPHSGTHVREELRALHEHPARQLLRHHHFSHRNGLCRRGYSGHPLLCLQPEQDQQACCCKRREGERITPNIQTSSVFYIPMKLRLSRSGGAAAPRFYRIRRKPPALPGAFVVLHFTLPIQELRGGGTWPAYPAPASARC